MERRFVMNEPGKKEADGAGRRSRLSAHAKGGTRPKGETTFNY